MAIRVNCVAKEARGRRKEAVEPKLRHLSRAHATVEAPSSSDPEVVQVGLGDRSYPIHIGEGLLEKGVLGDDVKGSSILVVTNDVLEGLHLGRAMESLRAGNPERKVEHVSLPDGEEHKTLEDLMRVYDKALELRMDRKCTFVALGGGVIGDMAGFAAATYQRGVDLVQVPTTVMAMVDSSVGGKTAVNHPLGKNMIGAFYQPSSVVIDSSVLSTLPRREFASGIAEIVKYGLIRDKELFEWLEGNMERLMEQERGAIAHAIKRSCVNKAEVVQQDEKEANLRATLNLGHTFGHAIETGTNYSDWLHGEAVSAGMVMAADLSARLGWISPSLVDRIKSLLARAELPLEPPGGKGLTAERFKDLMSVDKKASDGKTRLILLTSGDEPGACTFTGEYDEAKLWETLHHFARP